MKDTLQAPESSRFPKWYRIAAATTACMLGTGCSPAEINNVDHQPPKNPDTTIVTPATTPNATQFESPLEYATASTTPQHQETFLPAVENEPSSVVVFDGDPRSPEGQQLGDGGFRVDQGPDKKVLWGPFLRSFDQKDMQALGFDDSTLKITIDGTGIARCGATDSKMTGSSFGFHEATVQLPYTFEVYWPGLEESIDQDGNKTYNGYGFEVTCESVDQSNQNPVVTGVKIEKVGDGNLLEK